MKLNQILTSIICCLLLLGVIGCSINKKAEEPTLNRKIINPWSWQDHLGFVQGHEVTNGKRLLLTAGQVSVDTEGNLLHPGDMEKQITKVLDNMETLLSQSNFKLSDVVRFTYFTTDVQAFSKAAPNVLIDRLSQAGCMPATSLIGVKELFHPDAVVEIEATIID